MIYQVVLRRSAHKEFSKLPAAMQAPIADALRGLETTPRPAGVKRLQGRKEYRLRVGDYRILYEVNDAEHVITVSVIRHRREAYR